MASANIRLLVDSCCDLPASVLQDYGLVVIPSRLKFQDGSEFLDERINDEMILACMRQHDFEKQAQGVTPMGLDEMTQRLRAAVDEEQHQNAFVLTMTRQYSENYDAIESAVARINHKIKTNFRVLTSRVLFAGQGVISLEAARLVQEQRTAASLRERITRMADSVYTYAIPESLRYVRKRGKERGDENNRVPWLLAMLGDSGDRTPIVRFFQDRNEKVGEIHKSKEVAIERVVSEVESLILNGKLLSSVVVVSYAGELADLNQSQAIVRLRRVVQGSRYQLIETVMGMGGVYHLGPGSLTIGFSAMPHSME